MVDQVCIRFTADHGNWKTGDRALVNRILAGQLVERGIATYHYTLVVQDITQKTNAQTGGK